MALFKITYFFGLRAYGWSESFYKEGAFNIKQVADALPAYTARRANILARTAGIIGFRVSSVGASPIQSMIGQFPSQTTGVAPGAPGNFAKDCDQPNVAMLARCINSDFTKSKLTYLRGGPDDFCAVGGLFQPTAAYGNALDAWAAECKAQGFGWLSVGVPVVKNIANIVVEANNTITIQTTAAVFAAGDIDKHVQVRFKQIKGAVELNGQHLVQVVAEDTVRTVNQLAILPYEGGGSMRYSEKSFVALDDAEVERCVTRKAGRPFGLSAGRQSTRRAA